MPAMWDNLKTATGPSVHQLPPPELKKRQFLRPTQTLPLSKSTSSVNKLRNSDEDQDRAFWQNDFDNRLNGLGIQNGPFKYEIRRGKTVPQPDISGPRQLSPPLDSDDLRVRAPPRNQRLKADDEAHWRPTSSIYGDEDDSNNNHSRSHSHSRPHRKPSSTGRSKAKAPAKDMYGRPTAIEISPPSSPEFDAARNGGNHEDVSPIDEAPDMSQLELLQDARHTPSPQSHAHPRSQIPTMRRDKTRDQDHRPSPLRESKSIDQLRDQEKHGKHPWEGAVGQQASSSKPPHTFGLTTTVTGPRALRPSNPPTTFGQRMRKLRLKAEPVESRPPWNGASGRAPLVEPVRDDPSVAPLSLQRRVSKRVGLGGGTSPESPSGAASTVRRLLPSRSNQKLKDASKTPSPEPTSQAGTSHAYPSPPYSSSPPSQPPVSSHAARPVHAAPLLTPSTMPDQQKAIKRKPSPSAHISHASYSSSVYSALTEQTASGPAPLPNNLEPTSLFAPEDPWIQPPSRFSVTTCNTAAPESPRLSDDEDRPPMPTTSKLPSMMDRRRPVPGGDSFKRASNDPIIISMKTSSLSLRSDAASQDRTSTERPPSILVTDKALPLAPPEMQSANDRVAYLTARLDSLAHRRTNINKSIKQMTELMPTDNLLASADVIRRREIEKKKVEGLKEELAEIQREEYDLGLKLYRANKRLEREAAFEPSSLWVRRVTS
ncbi:hypothetical protein NW757_002526 [Fusarium falciforme]|nr:hypothetical protein NW757_002526 [Fusarium falciforme]